MADNTRNAASIVENSEWKVEKLNGKSNYLGWSKVIMSEFKQRNYWLKSGFTKSTEEKSAALILKSVSLKIAAMLPDDEGPEVMWEWLKSEYGSDDLYQIKKDLKSVKMVGIDLDSFWENFNMALALYKSAGGKINYEDQLDIILENINSEFYLDVIRKIRLEIKNAEVDAKIFFAAKDALKNHYNATPQKIRNKFKETSNFVEKIRN